MLTCPVEGRRQISEGYGGATNGLSGGGGKIMKTFITHMNLFMTGIAASLFSIWLILA